MRDCDYVTEMTSNEGKALRRGKKKQTIPMLEFKEVIPTQELFYDRKKLPPVLKNYVLPLYLQQNKCALIDEDGVNAGMQALLRSCYHQDLNLVMQMPFENAFLIMYPTEIKMSPSDKRTFTLPQFILHLGNDKDIEDGAPKQQTPEQAEKEMLIVKTFNKLIEAKMFCHHDPREVAAAIIIVFCYYRYSEDQSVNLRRAVYLANVFLLGEGHIPIPYEALVDLTFTSMIEEDIKRWVARRDVHTEMTAGYIKSLVRKCDVCGQLKHADGRVNLPVMTCTKCKHGYYCSAICQGAAWKSHKPFCMDNREAIHGQKHRARPSLDTPLQGDAAAPSNASSKDCPKSE